MLANVISNLWSFESGLWLFSSVVRTNIAGIQVHNICPHFVNIYGFAGDFWFITEKIADIISICGNLRCEIDPVNIRQIEWNLYKSLHWGSGSAWEISVCLVTCIFSNHYQIRHYVQSQITRRGGGIFACNSSHHICSWVWTRFMLCAIPWSQECDI